MTYILKLFLKLILFMSFFSSFIYADLIIAYGTNSGKANTLQKIDITKIKNIAKKNNIKIEFKSSPWKRALLLLKIGKIDGLMDASFKVSRADFAQYPMQNNLIDISKRLNDGASYYIYKNKKSSIIWDGIKFINPDGEIAVMANYAVIEDLKKHSNISIKKYNENVEIIRSLAKGNIAAYAGSSRVTDALLKRFPILSDKIIRENLAIRKKEYYLIFSKKKYSNKYKDIQSIWNGLKNFNKKNLK